MKLKALTNKAKSRIGTAPMEATIEQLFSDRMFVVADNGYCAWMPPSGGEHFDIEEDEEPEDEEPEYTIDDIDEFSPFARYL